MDSGPIFPNYQTSSECADACSMGWPMTPVLAPQGAPCLPLMASLLAPGLSVSAHRAWTAEAMLLP